MNDFVATNLFVASPTSAYITNRQYKDTLFRALFKDKKRFIELYNAIAIDKGILVDF